jgi:hypothetical protein
MKQIVRKVYRIIKQDTEEGDVTTKLDVDKKDGKVFNQEQEAVEVDKHVVLPVDTYEQFDDKRSQRFSRSVTTMFLDHPERLKQ